MRTHGVPTDMLPKKLASSSYVTINESRWKERDNIPGWLLERLPYWLSCEYVEVLLVYSHTFVGGCQPF